MTSDVPTIRVPAGQTAWRADEVPCLTADALFRFEPKPDPLVTKAELRRFTSPDTLHCAAGRLLNERELSQFACNCKAAGLPEPDGLRHSQWRDYLDAFNQNAEERGWWAAFIPPRDPHQYERESWEAAAKAHRKLLQAMISNGEIQARNDVSREPAPDGTVDLHRLALSREGLDTFAARLEMRVVSESLELAAEGKDEPKETLFLQRRVPAELAPAQMHAIKSRTDPLAAVLAQARTKALDPNDWLSVWAALVELAQSPERPAPLLGFTEGEGVKYQMDNASQPVKWLTRDALRRRHNRWSRE